MSAGETMSTSSTGGQKAGNDVRPSLFPVQELLEVAELYGKGAKKYADHNWARGYEWSKSYDAMMRHAMEWWGGEEFDNGEGGTGQEHLDAVIFHALALKYFRKHFPEFDDRFKLPKRVEKKKTQELPRQVEHLNEVWMREYEWRVDRRYGLDARIYKWHDQLGPRGRGWYFRDEFRDNWLRSSENNYRRYVNNGPFTRI
ncbi:MULTISPECIES: dATP/dGTP diphosphohydrolase domain-containing protein [Mycobacteroides]|uniref:dATP/dGTP diphosphohydrolase domain-containing protein n=1 Tax=Mycobacteroides TaxID=670516 RepID=UPI001041EDF8|nr:MULTISPECIES: dATP/dGTP diphosphohydrolase domain-containing protein [Mycobacteroides]